MKKTHLPAMSWPPKKHKLDPSKLSKYMPDLLDRCMIKIFRGGGGAGVVTPSKDSALKGLYVLTLKALGEVFSTPSVKLDPDI